MMLPVMSTGIPKMEGRWGSSGPLPAYGGENGEIAKDGLFSFFGDLFAVTTLPHLPSIFGIPVLITGSIILLFLLAEYIPERFMRG